MIGASETWGAYDRTGLFSEHIRAVYEIGSSDIIGEAHAVEVYAKASESVGINNAVSTLVGKAIFEYKAVFSGASILNLYCCMIPVQKEERLLVEVGATYINDPDNPFSPYRKRYYVKLGRVPKKEEIDQVFLLSRVMYRAVLGLHYQRQQQKKTDNSLYSNLHIIHIV